MQGKVRVGRFESTCCAGDLWSPKVVGYLSDRWGDLQRACLWALPGTLVLSAVLWCWLVVVEKRRVASGL